MGQRYRKMEDQNPGLACNLNFAKGEELEAKVKRLQKLSKLGGVVSKLV